MPDLIADLLAYIDRSPTPYHAVAETERRLSTEGYERLEEGELWDLGPGARRYLVRTDSRMVLRSWSW